MEITAPQWWSQPVRPDGSIMGTGVLRQLGTPSLELIDVLVREAAQNSWDAGLPEGDLRFSISFKRLGEHAQAWRELIGDSRKGMNIVVGAGELTEDSWILIVGDRGTSGLGGPILAGEQTQPGVSPDFVQFLRNVGEPRDRDLGGGTYGFGKAIFYNLSRCHAIVVDTNCVSGTDRRRLMGAALGAPFTTPRTQYTGRHWWGVTDDRNVPLPLTGSDAADVAAALGLPGFAGGATGTDVVVLLPVLTAVAQEDSKHGDQRQLVDAAAERVVSAILWNLWPRLGSAQRAPQVTISVSVEDEVEKIKKPDEYPFLRPFSEALDAIEAGKGDTIDRERIRYPGAVGHYRIQLCNPDPSSGSRQGLLLAKPFDGPYHHVARMRQARLIVDYLECEPYPGQDFGYAGVFLATREFDQCFADAEPPTHDKWETAGLPEKARLVVKYAMTHLKTRIKDFVAEKAGTRSSDLAGLGRLSSKLAPLLPFDGRIIDDGPRGPRPGGGQAGGGGESRARILEEPRLHLRNGEVRMFAKVKPPKPGHRSLVLSADPFVVLDDGRRERDAPAGAPVPEALGWYDEAWNLLVHGPELSELPPHRANAFLYVEISRIPNAAIGLKIQTSES